MRLLFVHNSADLYGASRSFLRLCSRLHQDGVKIKAVLPCEGPLQKALSQVGIECSVLQTMPLIERQAFRSFRGILGFLWKTPVSVFQIMRLIRAFRPDLVHSNLSVLYTPVVAAWILRVPHIWHIRESYAEFPGFWRLYRQIMVFWSDRIVAVSEAIAAQFAGCGRASVSVVHNGFPAAEFEPVSPDRIREFKQCFGLEGRLLIGLVGRIKRVRKGQETLVEAASLLRQQFPEARFLVIGSPFPGNESHLERLRQQIQELQMENQIVLTGDVEDIKAAYAALDISVMASGLPEPFGGVVVESMALGKPVVGTAIGGTVEQIEDGVTGLLVPPRDPEAMARALARLMEDAALRQRMGQAGRERFEERFEFEPFYLKMRKIYNEVCA